MIEFDKKDFLEKLEQIVELEEALKEDPSNIELLEQLAENYQILGQKEELYNCYRKLSSLYKIKENFDKAIEYIERSKRLVGDTTPTKEIIDNSQSPSLESSKNVLSEDNKTLTQNNPKFIWEYTDRYINTVVGGRYLIEKELGKGGIGIVYLAKDQQMLSRKVVIKVLLDEKGTDEWLKTKFRQEIEALSRIDHPGVVGILDTGQMLDGKAYFVMQFIEGVSLRSIIKPQGVELDRVVNIIKQLGAALQAAHNKQIFHRDLKPENVMLHFVGNQEQVKLIDFGIAKVKNSSSGESTPVPVMAGTFLYMSPEQFSGAKITAASDVFALAVIAYEMITGRLPFYSESHSAAALLIQLMQMQKNGPRVKPKALRPTISEAAEAVLLKGLAYDFKERYKSANEFADDLAATLKAQGTEDFFINKIKNDSLDEVTITSKTQSPIFVPTRQEPNSKTSEKTTSSLVDSVSKISSNTSDYSIERSVIKSNQSRNIIIGIPVVIFLILAGLLIPKLFDNQQKNTQPISTKENKVPNQELAYWIMVQRYRNGKPYKAPYRLAQEIVFQADDHIKLYFTSKQLGYLYVLNEGPPNKDGSLPNANILFPTPFIMSEVIANKALEIAGNGDGFYFDNQEGTEKVFLIFSLEKVDLLEDLRKWINEEDLGEIKNSIQMDAVRKFIQANSTKKTVIQKDEANKQTTITSSEKIVVIAITLTHM